MMGRTYCTLKGNRSVMGSIVPDPKDGVRRLFFIFPNLSVRIAGKYRIATYIQDMNNLEIPIFTATTDPFIINTSRYYTGRIEPTELTKALYRIGALDLARLGSGLRKGGSSEEYKQAEGKLDLQENSQGDLEDGELDIEEEDEDEHIHQANLQPKVPS